MSSRWKKPDIDPAELVNIERMIDQGLNNVVEHGHAVVRPDGTRRWEYEYAHGDTRMYDFWWMCINPNFALEKILEKCLKRRFKGIIPEDVDQIFFKGSSSEWRIKTKISFRHRLGGARIPDFKVCLKFEVRNTRFLRTSSSAKIWIEGYEKIPRVFAQDT